MTDVIVTITVLSACGLAPVIVIHLDRVRAWLNYLFAMVCGSIYRCLSIQNRPVMDGFFISFLIPPNKLPVVSPIFLVFSFFSYPFSASLAISFCAKHHHRIISQ